MSLSYFPAPASAEASRDRLLLEIAESTRLIAAHLSDDRLHREVIAELRALREVLTPRD